MPEGRTVDELRHKAGYLLDLCKQKGYRYCNRLHIELFGNTRGT
jgi:7-carboxy-7-deazaguanine synthase